jgi:hypothetical protein
MLSARHSESSTSSTVVCVDGKNTGRERPVNKRDPNNKRSQLARSALNDFISADRGERPRQGTRLSHAPSAFDPKIPLHKGSTITMLSALDISDCCLRFGP